MNKPGLSIREICEDDIDPIIRYWLDAEPDFLTGMGVDLNKMPSRKEWDKMLRGQLSQPIEKKQSYCLIWLLNGKASGHSNINKIIPGEEAYMHLHLWNSAARKNGLGSAFVKLSLPWFFEKYKLKKLCCEPYALNPAPNKVLEKCGFTFIKRYTTTPGWINFLQEVNHWEISRKASDR